MTQTLPTPRDRTFDSTDAVVAAYIHEISARHPRRGARSRPSHERDSARPRAERRSHTRVPPYD